MTGWKRKTLNGFLILVIGGLGGVMANQFLLPYLSAKPPFSDIEFIHQAGNGTVIVNPTEKIIIEENRAIERAVAKIGASLVLVQSFKDNRVIDQGTGFIMTSDGLLITAGDLINPQADGYLVYQNGNNYQAKLIKKDLEQNIALLKIEVSGLNVVTMAGLEQIALGERVILVAAELIDNQINQFVNLGIIRSINKNTLRLNFQETNLSANGSPLVNVKGELIGMNLVNEQGWQKTIPNNIIKDFVNLN